MSAAICRTSLLDEVGDGLPFFFFFIFKCKMENGFVRFCCPVSVVKQN